VKIELQRVHYMPKELRPGVLYVSEEFGAAAHLCACGCGAKIRTPLSPTDWSLEETENGPTLYPSIGNWQQACQSHYWIRNGEIVWSDKWTADEIKAGRCMEEERSNAYYKGLELQRGGVAQRLWRWFKSLF
jgi:hypothetical protein